ncbi:Mitochondrial RNA pseudouridine synthase rpusd4 [Rhizophlyctis rosea]|nr:Mitochondrial RNA pseudouridine synthase rpusd4 [Rhizophlyctis rosea]
MFSRWRAAELVSALVALPPRNSPTPQFRQLSRLASTKRTSTRPSRNSKLSKGLPPHLQRRARGGGAKALADRLNGLKINGNPGPGIKFLKQRIEDPAASKLPKSVPIADNAKDGAEGEQAVDIPEVQFRVVTKKFPVGHEQHRIRLDDFVKSVLGVQRNVARLKIMNDEAWINPEALHQLTHHLTVFFAGRGSRVNARKAMKRKPVWTAETKAYFRAKEAKDKLDIVENLKSNILYRDDRIIVINKPAGLAVQGGSKIRIHVDKLLGDLQQPDSPPLRLVHRLDKDTTGALIIARTKSAATQMADIFQNGGVQKWYWAVTTSIPPRIADTSGEIVTGMVTLGEPPNEKQKLLAWHDDDARSSIDSPIRKAVTTYRTLSTKKGLSLLELQPVTGRKHQLRLHCAGKLHENSHLPYIATAPIVGDYKYGPGCPEVLKAMAPQTKRVPMYLHMRAVVIKNWFGEGVDLTVVAPPPSHFVKTAMSIGLKLGVEKE